MRMSTTASAADRASLLESLRWKKFPVLDDGFVALVDCMGDDGSVVQAARVSYGEGTRKVSDDRQLIRYLLRHAHTTPFEMAELKFVVRVPMDCWRQWIRHRTASVNEYSTRYSLAIDAMQAAKTPHSFLGIDNDGGTCVVTTTGNPWGVLMLRGGRSGSNYSPEILHEARAKLEATGLPACVIVDCSHANSGKDHRRQSIVWRDVLSQRVAGDRSIVGMMLESNIHPGSQPVSSDRSRLQYGVSVTDGCIGWEETEELLLEAHARLA
jgi:hypothetical protein